MSRGTFSFLNPRRSRRPINNRTRMRELLREIKDQTVKVLIHIEVLYLFKIRITRGSPAVSPLNQKEVMRLNPEINQ